jgi:hypothetical protein
MKFKEWLSIKEGGMVSKGQAQPGGSLAKPGPGDIRPKPHDGIHVCGVAGGPGPCQSSGGAAQPKAPASASAQPKVG